MKKFFLLLGIFASVFLLSCQKEKSIENGSGGFTSTSGLLARTVIKVNTDSIARLNTYDVNKRLVSLIDVSTVSGFQYQNETKIVRDAKGIVQKLVVYSDALFSAGLDSLVYVVNYDAAKSRYTSKVTSYNINGTIIRDSTAFTYDAAGKVAKLEEFLNDGSSGGPAEYTKTQFTYDGSGNVSKVSFFIFDQSSGAYVQVSEDTYEFDSKTNPLYLGLEGFLLDEYTLTSTHNVTKLTSKDLTNPSNNDVQVTTYVYNSNNKPQTATFTSQSLGVPLPVTYVYL